MNIQELYSALTDFPSFFKTFQTNYQGLLAQSDFVVNKHPELRPDWEKLVASGSETYTKLYNINDALNALKSYGLTAWDWVTGNVPKGDGTAQGLGILPWLAISLATVGASLAAASYWLSDARTMSIQIEERKRLEATGMSPVQAAKLADTAAGAQIKLFGIPVKWLLVGAGIIILGPTILSLIKSRRA